jgi:hypothetical protein
LRARFEIFNVAPTENLARNFLMKKEHDPASIPGRTGLLALPEPRPLSDLNIPPLLFEDDEDPSEKTVETAPEISSGPELPSVSEQARMMLMPRDPHSIYAHWEVTAQEGEISAREPAQPLVVNVHRGDIRGPLAAQVHVSAESNHAFIRVPEGGGKYVAELCYLNSAGAPVSLASSAAVSTPQETISPDRSVVYAEVPTVEMQLPSDRTLEEKSKPSQFVPPPMVSWIPALPLLGASSEGIQDESTIAQEMISSIRNNFAELPEFKPLAEDYRAFETFELEYLLGITMSQLRGGDSSF